jgi:hypothetical protein
MSEIGARIADLIDALMQLLAAIVTPDWGALIALLPLIVVPLVLLYLAATGGIWTLVAVTKRGARIAPRDEAPIAAPRGGDGRPHYAPGRPFDARHALIYPAGQHRAPDGTPLSLACPGCGAVRLAELARCAGCGMEIRQRSVVRLERPAGPPPGGSANA